jgi:methylated-DNA-protein-cysteine methyltransferase-like protein
MTESFHDRIIATIKKVPQGSVATYGQIAAIAGNPQGARQVAWVLNSSSSKEKLPWHRIINKQGRISLESGAGYEEQRSLLEKEGIIFSLNGSIDLKRFLWTP